VKEWRVAAGGFAGQWVSSVERGENLTIHSLARLANALGVRVVVSFEEPAAGAEKVRRGRQSKQRGRNGPYTAISLSFERRLVA
jgi:transcriptional regulator with XRE-family HTH domain